MLNTDMFKTKNIKAFIKGATRVTSIFGDLERRPTFEKNDAKALQNDWVEVGIGIQGAIDEYGSRKKHQPV
jgi:hypothetical protein